MRLGGAGLGEVVEPEFRTVQPIVYIFSHPHFFKIQIVGEMVEKRAITREVMRTVVAGRRMRYGEISGHIIFHLRRGLGIPQNHSLGGIGGFKI